MASVTCTRRGKASNIKTISVDVPCSKQVFTERIASYLPVVNYHREDKFKCTVSPSDLDDVFGENWHNFIFRNSSTMKRIIGVVVLLFRKKIFKQHTADQLSR